MNFPQNLKYTNEHEWIRVDGDIAYVGITDYAQEQLGDIVFVDIPTVGETLEAGETFGTIEVVKTISDLFLPIAGEVLEHFADVSQQMAGRVIGILTDSTPLNIETWKFEQLLLKHTALFGRKLRHEHLMGVFGITGVHPAVLDVLHPFVKLLTGNVQGTAKVECIQLRHLPRHKRNIIGRLVKHEQLTVTVVDSPP